MAITEKLDQIVKQLVASIPPGVRGLPKELEKQFHQILHSAFNKLDLVTRDEFDAQVQVLQRTRKKLEELSKQVAALQPAKKKASKKD